MHEDYKHNNYGRGVGFRVGNNFIAHNGEALMEV